MKRKYNALIIGAGNIGAFNDTPIKKEILTHAHAYSEHEKFNLIGFVDSDFEKAQKAARIWDTNAFKKLEEAFDVDNIDVISVCVPDNLHFCILNKISDYPIKLVFAEKPLTKTLYQADTIIKKYNEKEIPILANYSRRFVLEFEELSGKIKSGNFGKYITGNGYYGKGILHNGSHAIDLLRFLIGEIKDFSIMNFENDFYDDDPSVALILKFENEKVFCLQTVNCNQFTIFDMEFIFEKAKIKIKDFGLNIEEYEVKQNSIFKDYKNLSLLNVKETTLYFSLYNAVNNIYDFLNANAFLKCTVNDGYKAMEIPIKILEKINK